LEELVRGGAGDEQKKKKIERKMENLRGLHNTAIYRKSGIVLKPP
jgi:hypothetical protein